MPRKVKAAEGDSLCGLAVRAGFPNCDALRALTENADFKSRPLQAGDVVTLPDRKSKTASTKTGASTKLTINAAPVPRVRFVHGSPNLPFDKDPTLHCLDVSNFVTNLGGATQGAAFPKAFGFSPDGHGDPDAFKVEVVMGGGSQSLTVQLEALRPVSRGDGSVVRHEPFTGSEHDARKLDVECQPGPHSPSVYRSRYLRLVTDDVDQAAAPSQTLLVTDLADGEDGEADQLEILDQRVRASIDVPGCKAPPADRCRARAELPVGKSHRRVRLCVHVYRSTPDGAPVGGLNQAAVRLRVRRWFRRLYAQAGIAPRLVDPAVEFINPPPADMLVISEVSGLRTSGVDGSGAASTLSFSLDSPPGSSAPGATVPAVSIQLVPGMTARMVAAAVVGALPSGYSARVFPNPRMLTAADASCDVLISKDDGSRVMIRDEATTDTRLPILVSRVNLDDVDRTPNGAASNPDLRRVLRGAETKDDRLDYFIIGQFRNPALRGRAFPVQRDLALPFRPTPSLRLAVVIAASSASGPVMDHSDNVPFAFPHEAGHVLMDAFHAFGANSITEMMTGEGTNKKNAVDASKRICDSVKVRYDMLDPAQPTPGAQKPSAISAVHRMRSHGAAVMEDW